MSKAAAAVLLLNAMPESSGMPSPYHYIILPSTAAESLFLIELLIIHFSYLLLLLIQPNSDDNECLLPSFALLLL